MFKRMKGESYFAYIALVNGIVCIGFSAIFVRFANISGSASAFYRILFAGIIIIPWWLIRKRTAIPLAYLILIGAGGIFFALDLTLWNTSVLYTSAATSTLLANNAPLWVGLGALVFFREKLSPRYWIGLAISLAGMSLLVGMDAWQQLQINKGDAFAIGASFFYAGYLLITQKARTRFDTLTFMAISVMSCFSILLVFNLVMGVRLTGYSTKTWAALVALGIITHLGGWLSINYALGHLRAAPVSVSLLGQAVVTALLAIPLLGENLGVIQIAGGFLVLCGIYIANRRRVIPERNKSGSG